MLLNQREWKQFRKCDCKWQNGKSLLLFHVTMHVESSDDDEETDSYTLGFLEYNSRGNMTWVN